MFDSFTTPGTVVHQAPLSMGFSRKEYWSGLPLFSPRDIPDPGIKPASPELAGGFFTSEPGKLLECGRSSINISFCSFLCFAISATSVC